MNNKQEYEVLQLQHDNLVDTLKQQNNEIYLILPAKQIKKHDIPHSTCQTD